MLRLPQLPPFAQYIHLNPVRAGIVKTPEEYEWSSLPIYLKGRARLPFTLQWEWILSLYGKSRSIAARKYLEFIYEGIKVEKNPIEEAKGGWILGNDQWMEKVIEKWGYFSSKELSGVKAIKTKIPIGEMERLVCRGFNVIEDDLRKATYNNIARNAIIYLAVKYCGLTLKKAGQRYGGANYSAVGKAISRFKERLTDDRKLNKQIKQILYNVKM